MTHDIAINACLRSTHTGFVAYGSGRWACWPRESAEGTWHLSTIPVEQHITVRNTAINDDC